VEGPADPNRPTVAILAPASVYKLSIAREGGAQSPGDVHLVLDPSWLIQEVGTDGRNKLYLTKGLTFDAEGRPVLAEYQDPRPVGYFANFYTMGGNDRDDGVPLESNLDVPMSSSLQLEKETNDKLLTRVLMAAKGVAVPATLAFVMAGHPLMAKAQDYKSAEHGMRVVERGGEGQGPADGVRASVEAFLADYKGSEVVVKPSGPVWHSGKGVRFIPRDKVEEIVRAVLDLSSKVNPEDVVLVDGRILPPELTWDDGRRMDFNFRVLAARAPWDGGETTGIFARVGPWGIPTTAEPPSGDPRDAAQVVKLETILEKLGLPREEAEALVREMEDLGVRVLEALKGHESKRVRQEGEPFQAQTDYLGLDVMVERREGRLVPLVIEVNDHDSGGQWQMDGFYPERRGEHSRAWVATMLQRARRHALRGKRIVVVGAGYPGKRPIFEKARELGVKVVLVDKADTWAKDLVEAVVDVDNADIENGPSKAREGLEALGLSVDGVTTFWEDDVPAAGRLAKLIGKRANSPESADLARSKALTRLRMAKAGLPTPRFAFFRAEEGLDAAMEDVGFPAVLKPAFGAEAIGTYRVNTPMEAVAAYRTIIETLGDKDPIFKKYGTDMVLEQYLDGWEVDVDLILQDGVPVFSSVTDNHPTREPFFVATGSTLPSRLAPAKQAELAALAVEAVKALGLTQGPMHVEGKYTSEGPRLIEVNARMGGLYVRDWVKAVWGVDQVEEAFMNAAGIPIRPYKAPRPLVHLEGKFLIPERAGVLKDLASLEALDGDPRVHEVRFMAKTPTKVIAPPQGQQRVAMVTAQGRSSEEVRRNLEGLMERVELPIEPDVPGKI